MTLNGLNVTAAALVATNASFNSSTFSPSHEERNATFDFVLFQVVVPVIFGLVTLIGTIGNGLVIYVILSRQRMRTVTNLLLLNLGIADMSFVLVCVPFTAYQYSAQQFPFGNVVCKLMHYLLNVTCYVTVYTLVLISIIRYLTIIYNQQTMALRTKKNIVVMVIVIWILMMAVNAPVLTLYGIQTHPGSPDVCDLNHPAEGKSFYATFFVFAYLLPLLAIAALSLRILHYLNRQKPSSLLGKRKDQKKKQASRLIVLVVVIFALFWLPIHVNLLLAYHDCLPDAQWYDAVAMLWNTLAYFNSCVNPIIYNYSSKEFQDSFHDVIWCLRNKRQDGSHATSQGVTQLTVITKNNGVKAKEEDNKEVRSLIQKENNEVN